MECEVYQTIDVPVLGVPPPPPDQLPEGTLQTIFIGLIKMIHVRNAVMRQDSLSVDIALYKPISRIGGPNYARVGEGFNLPAPKWPEVEAKYRELESKAKAEEAEE